LKKGVSENATGDLGITVGKKDYDKLLDMFLGPIPEHLMNSYNFWKQHLVPKELS